MSIRSFAFFLTGALGLGAAPPVFHYEASQGLRTPRLEGTLEDCRALAQASPWVKVDTFGRTPQGRDLPLVIVDKGRGFTPASVRAAGKAVLMIQACIHAGESEGKDAGLLLLRALCLEGDPEGILDRVAIVFLPIYNLDGHERFGPHNRINQDGPEEMGWRATATGLNLNRDYLKADAPETRAWLRLHAAWLPDFMVDCHTTDGADYQYPLTYSMEAGPDDPWFLEPSLASWIRERFLPEWRRRLEGDGVEVFPYVSFRRWHDPRSGLVGGPASPRYSTGYQSAQNRPGLLLETHMLKPYRVRVQATLAALRHVAALVAREGRALRAANLAADASTAGKAFRASPMPLAFREDGPGTEVAFKGYAYEAKPSDLTGGLWFTYHRDRPETFRIPYANHMKVVASARVPEAYLVPAEWTEVIARLEAHGIQGVRLPSPLTLQVATWRFRDPRWSPRPVEGRHRLEQVGQEEALVTRTFPAGSFLVPTAQRTARVLVHLLEPASEDSLLRWGCFDTVFEQKEYGESYALEPLARRMLAADPALRKAYEARKASDPAFAADPEAQLNWFYRRSPWGDPNLEVYPVGRLFDLSPVRGLLAP